MDTRNFTRVLIETAVERGIRDVTNDPKRSLRRLADLGKQYSEGRFQKAAFGHITNLLKNDDSPYYKLLENFLATVDHRMIKTFGLNMGYDSWTYGARLIRKEAGERGYMLPWVVQLHYDEHYGALKASDINDLINTLKPLGVNTYVIMWEHGISDTPALLNVLKAHTECAFFLFVNDGLISPLAAEELKAIGNAVISVNISAMEAASSCRMLKEMKFLYLIHYLYNADDVDRFSYGERMEEWLSYGSAFIFLIQKDSDRGLAGRFAKRARMEQEFPILIWDVYSDIRLINEMISDVPFIFEISSDGSVIYPKDTGMNILDADIISVLGKVAPPFRPLADS